MHFIFNIKYFFFVPIHINKFTQPDWKQWKLQAFPLEFKHWAKHKNNKKFRLYLKRCEFQWPFLRSTRVATLNQFENVSKFIRKKWFYTYVISTYLLWLFSQLVDSFSINWYWRILKAMKLNKKKNR